LNTLSKEISDASKRIENGQVEIDAEIIELTSKIKTFTIWAWIFVWVGFAITIFAVIFYIYKNTEIGYGLNLLGDFMSGTVSSIWSLAGLFFIYVAFLGQKQQLLNQQLEIMYSQLEVKYTRLELQGQKKEMKVQNETLKQQKFENTFFQMLNLFHSIVNSIDLKKNLSAEIISTGRDCFEIFYNRFNGYYNVIESGDTWPQRKINEVSMSQTIDCYDKLYKQSKSDLSHYYRTIYHIFKFIDNSNIKNKKQYASIARAQLSSYEQVMIFYNCLHPNGRDKFKPLIEKYQIFKNIDSSLLLNEKEHLKEYKKNAYGN